MRTVYNAARQIKEKQDAFCARAEAVSWADVHTSAACTQKIFWGKPSLTFFAAVPKYTHYYAAQRVQVRIGFRTPRPEAYLVTETLKRAFSSTPAAAIFATNARYKREAYRGSEFAPPKILHEAGILVDEEWSPVMDSRNLLYEAQQAFFYGLPADTALVSVTSTAAFDIPKTLNFGRTVKYDGLPPLAPDSDSDIVAFTNVTALGGSSVAEGLGTIVVDGGQPQSVSTQVAALRSPLRGGGIGDLGDAFTAVPKGKLPLIADVASADIIATLIELKAEVDSETGGRIRIFIPRAHEVHLLAPQLAKATLGVILNPSRPYPLPWSTVRMLPGPLLSKRTAVQVLLDHGVTVGLGVEDAWMARNTRFDVAWAALETGGALSQSTAFALASSNFEKLFDLEFPKDLVAYEGGDMWSSSAKSVAVISSSKGCVDMF
ncbi:hypothetical protein BKA62DRAFT_766461 [Auriculariales sp. MPI-PUGE-AT-0066]|nr:hypothetical protein BKA62DRAFT_766461 [Auriculariales sp. MPI-PUGE-AT-0066]